MDKFENDTRNFALTEQAIQKSDKDIATITALNEYIKKSGNLLVIYGGYAVEALCGEEDGGEVTRAHGDVDVHIIDISQTPFEQILPEVEEILQKEETKWNVRSKKRHKLDYLEDDDSKEFFDKRRVEVTVHNPNPDKPLFVKRKLRDSKGNMVEIYVPDPYELTASKIYKLYEVRNGIDESKDRHPSKTDLNDLKRLLGIKDFSKEKLFEALLKTVQYYNPLETDVKAQEIFDYSTSLLN